jgi:hypothetical protein
MSFVARTVVALTVVVTHVVDGGEDVFHVDLESGTGRRDPRASRYGTAVIRDEEVDGGWTWLAGPHFDVPSWLDDQIMDDLSEAVCSFLSGEDPNKDARLTGRDLGVR